MPVRRDAFQVLLIKVSSISARLSPPLTPYCSMRLTLSALNKKESGISAAVSAGDRASNASPVLLLNNSRESEYPAGLGGMAATILEGNSRNGGCMQVVIASNAFSCSARGIGVVVTCPSPRNAYV